MTEATGTTTITMNGTRKPSIFLSNKMTGVPFFNFPWFDATRDRLNALGWDVVSPADIDRAAGFDAMNLPADTDWTKMPDGVDYAEVMLRDYEAEETCDAIFIGNLWEDSPGACREVGNAHTLGLREFYEDVCASPDPSVMCSMADDVHVVDPLLQAMRDFEKACDDVTGIPPSQPEVRYTDREGVLDDAKSLICGDRNATYGPPSQDFQRTADMMNALFGWMIKDGNKFKSRDVAWIMMLVKASRSQHSLKRDNYVDAAGYAACGWECEVESKKREDIA